MSILKLKLEDLNTRNLQTRAALNEDTVADYAEAMERGDRFPAVTVFTDGAEYYLADGFHRVEALRRIGKKAVMADLQNGDFKDALLYALKANSTHGLRRTNADKRHALEMAWNAREELFGGEPSNALLAEICGVTRQWVIRWVQEQGVNRLHPVKSENAQNGEETPKTRNLPIRPQMTGKQPPERAETPSAPIRPATPKAPIPAPVRRVGRDGKIYAVPVRHALKMPTRPERQHAAIPHDRYGTEIPVEINAAFEANPLADILSCISKARVALRKGMDEHDPAFGAVRQDALVNLNNAYNFINAAEPHCVCRMCQGTGCKACHNRGWQTEEEYKRNPKEFQAKGGAK